MALGAGSVANEENTVSVGSAGNERRITHVADGVNASDAATVRQLNQTNQRVDNLASDLADTKTQVSNLAERLANVDVTALSSDLAVTNGKVTELTNKIAPISNAIASGTGSVAYGEGAKATGTNSTAIGTNTSAAAENSVAIGSGSVADEANTVSVGSAENERRITHVAKGVNATDAVNVQQLNEAISSIGGDYSALTARVNKLDTRIDRVGAMASAISGLQPLPYDPESPWQVLVGVGSYDGTAEAIGVSYFSNDSTAFKLSLAASGSEVMGNLGFAWKFGKSTRQAAEMEQKADANSNTVTILQAQVQQLQEENRKQQEENEKLHDKLQKQQEQIEALQQLVEKIVNSNTEKQ